MYNKECAYPDRIYMDDNALCFELRKDDPHVYGSTRSEVQLQNRPEFNCEYVYEWRTHIPVDWIPGDSQARCVIQQVHSSDAGPDWNGTIQSINLIGGELQIKIRSHADDTGINYHVEEIPYGQWIRWRMHCVFGEEGVIKFFRNDEWLFNYEGPTVYGTEQGSHFLKWGIYQHRWSDERLNIQTRFIKHDLIAI